MDPTVVSPESFNFIALFIKADWVVKLVMLGLGLASLWSWTVILDKTFRFSALNREANRFEDEVLLGDVAQRRRRMLRSATAIRRGSISSRRGSQAIGVGGARAHAIC